MTETHSDRHIVGFYESDDDLTATVAEFLAPPLRDGFATLVIATPAHEQAIGSSLGADGFDLGGLRKRGRYIAIDAQRALDAFMRAGRPVPSRFRAAIEPLVAEVGGAYAFGEMVNLLWQQGNPTAALELEELWNDLAARHDLVLFCGYALEVVRDANDLVIARRVCDEHSDVVLAGTSRRSEPPEDRDIVEELFVPCTDSVGHARALVRDAIAAWGLDAISDDAAVVTSEIATNAVRHARSPFRLRLERTRSGATIAVDDAAEELFPSEVDRTAKPDSRGLLIIARLASAWGVDGSKNGKTVWAHLEAAS